MMNTLIRTFKKHYSFSCGAAAQLGPWSPHSWGF